MKNIELEQVLNSIEAIRENITDASKIPLIFQSIERMDRQITEINVKLDNKFVTREQFLPVKAIVYGGVSLALSALGVALIATVMR